MMALSSPPDSDEPLVRGVTFHAFHEAVANNWGSEHLRAIVASLPREIAQATYGAEYRPLEWYPVAYMIAWHEALHAGLARGEDDVYRSIIDRQLDVTLGRLRRALMRMMNPIRLAQRAQELWRSYHSHGETEVRWDDSSSVHVLFRGHPFVGDRLGRLSFAETVRYSLALSGAKRVTEEHAMDGETLVVAARWEP
jgi:uncharacterized protein (TIGR02265 family)